MGRERTKAALHRVIFRAQAENTVTLDLHI